jgi:hypothetical protein
VHDENGMATSAPCQLTLAPFMPHAIVTSFNAAAVLAVPTGIAAPACIVRSILLSQFLSWTGALAVSALSPLYRIMVLVRGLCLDARPLHCFCCI